MHTDARSDNILLGRDGAVTVVDWPWASRGAAWLDPLVLLVEVHQHGGHDMGALLAGCAARAGADPADLIAALAGLAGHYADCARQPPPPGAPTVRAFQRAQAEAALGLLRSTVDGTAGGRVFG